MQNYVIVLNGALYCNGNKNVFAKEEVISELEAFSGGAEVFVNGEEVSDVVELFDELLGDDACDVECENMCEMGDDSVSMCIVALSN